MRNNNRELGNNNIETILEKLTTFQKIIKLQEDLKIISSIKKQFEGNRKRMIEKIYLGCQNYYKNKISMKKVFDYCSCNAPEKLFEYNLLTTKQIEEIFGEDNYNILFNFFFLLRNDNKLMLKVIEYCDKNDYEDISDFLVNFCYEDTINSTFIQEEMLLLIYLLIEKSIIKSFNNDDNKLIIKSYDDYISKNILKKIFISLTRKADIRNYLCNILSDVILYMEKLGNLLTVDIGKIHEIIIKNKKDKNINKFYMARMSSSQSGQIYEYIKKLSNDNQKRFSIIQEYNKNNINIMHKSTIRIPKSKLNNEININQKIKFGSNVDKKINQIDDIGSDFEESENESENENDIEQEIEKDLIIPDPFFQMTDTNLSYLENKLKEYEEYKIDNLGKLNNNIIEAMKYYLGSLINDIKSDENKIEKYSNFILINSINSQKNLQPEEDMNLLINYIKSNYQIIIEIISDFLNNIKKNLNSIPFFIKSILNIFDILLNYKYQNNIPLFHIYMFKVNFFFGNIIIPVLENPFYNGIISNNIISDITIKNCKLISSILKLIISGKLFYIGIKPCMTIFNQFVIEILPEIFEIIQKIETNFKLPEIIKELISTIKDIDDINRKIDYNYFYENYEEKFQIQSVCFSYKNILNIIKATEKCKDELIKINKEKKDIIDLFINNKKISEIILNNIQKKSKKIYSGYIYISKINYLPSLENKMNSILKDNFIGDNPPLKGKNKEEEVSRFKRCLSEVLTYANLIHKEDLPKFTEINSNKYVYNKVLIELLLKKLEKERYLEIMGEKENRENINKINSKSNSNNNNNIINPDFKNEILPKILLKVKGELGSNSSDNSFQRILYCCSYIQLHIDLLPKEYCLNNYKALFIELIKDTEANVHILRNNILNQLNIKIKGSLKTNLIISSTYNQIKNMEKLKCIEYLYSKLEMPSKFHINYSIKGDIKNINYEEESENLSLNKLEKTFPDFHKYEEKEDILILEEKVEMDKALTKYFQNLKKLVKKENIIKRYNAQEIENICYDFVDFIMGKLYHKLFPSKKSKMDIKFHKKCCRLQFIKPENLIKDKNVINESLCKESLKYINDIDKKIMPGDKLKCIGKAFGILQNSIKFSSGEKELGIDDTLKPLIYVVIKAKPENIFSNYNYCRLYLDKDMNKIQLGAFLTQIGMIIKIINDMTYKDLINITEEQFGKDDE